MLVRRYTPPTCTLELSCPPSSAWRNFSFQLRFDDPRLPEAEQVNISGSNSELEQIAQLVEQYVHTLLCSNKTNPNGDNNSGNTPSLYSPDFIHHELSFKDLAKNANQPLVKLTPVQLFDLVTALDQYATEMELFKNSITTRETPKSYLWGGIMAAIALGITVGAVFLTRKSPQPSPVVVNTPNSKFQLTPLVTPTPTPQSVPPVTTPTPAPSIASRSPLPSPTPAPSAPPPPQFITPVPTPVTQPPVVSINPPPLPPPPAKPKPPTVPEPVPYNEAALPSFTPPSTIPNQVTPESSRASELPSPLQQGGDVAAAPTPSIPLTEQIDHAGEVKSYFQQRWQPPDSLKETLEYRVMVNPDGTVARIIPVGKAARIYVDRTGMPLMGERLTSNYPDAQNRLFRVVLSPDGTVHSFLEPKATN